MHAIGIVIRKSEINGCRLISPMASIVAFFFFPDAPRALREMRRVLTPNGRVAIYTTSPEAKGTMAAPYPLATRGHFYTDEELKQLALEGRLRHTIDGTARLITTGAANAGEIESPLVNNRFAYAPAIAIGAIAAALQW